MFREPQSVDLDREPRLRIITLLPERPVVFPGSESNWKTLSGSSSNEHKPPRGTTLAPASWSPRAGPEDNQEVTRLSREAPSVACVVHNSLSIE